MRFEQSEEALKKAGPQFERAQTLDTRISSTLSRQSECEISLAKVTKKKTDLHNERVKQRRAVEQMNERLEVLQRTLREGAALEQISKRSADLASIFQNLGDLALKRKDLEASTKQIKASSEAATKQLAQNTRSAQSLRARLDEQASGRRRKSKKTQLLPA